ncbi:uncharacterized protein [Montipora foliosa]|uniref:uncharacterized protein n=1 Tax=Montipora foliosa TaxID=591990 RepID=UPI0035F1C050
MKTTTTDRNNGRQWTLWTQQDDLDFADDLALLSHNQRQMQDKTTHLEITSAGTGLNINRKKMELIKINTTTNTPVTVSGEPIKACGLPKRSAQEPSCAYSTPTSSPFCCPSAKHGKRQTRYIQQRIHTFFNTCLRRIFNVRWPEKIRNEDLWERAGQKPVVKQIMRRRWGWIGHTLRKPASITTRQALTWNPQGKRKRGRPRNSWSRDTEAVMKQKGSNWTGLAREAQNRVRWRGVVDGLCSTRNDGLD